MMSEYLHATSLYVQMKLDQGCGSVVESIQPSHMILGCVTTSHMILGCVTTSHMILGCVTTDGE